MNRRPVVPIVIALLLALGATVFAARWMQKRVDAARTEASGTVPVVVVTREIPFGEKIDKAAVQVVAWPNDVAPLDGFQKIEEVEGKFSNLRLFPGDVLLKVRITDRTAGNELSMLVQPNHRAVTVRVNDVVGVAGFLLPGNRVDVLATRQESGQRNRAETRTILQNRKVLAVDQTAPSADRNEPVVVRAVTLELTPEEAEQLASSTKEGSVQLALRNPDDIEIVETAARPQAAPAPVKRASSPRRASPAKTTEAPKEDTVTVIRQAQMNETVER